MTQPGKPVGIICGMVTLLSVYAMPVRAQNATGNAQRTRVSVSRVQPEAVADTVAQSAAPADQAQTIVETDAEAQSTNHAAEASSIEGQAVQRRGQAWLRRDKAGASSRESDSGWLSDGLWALGLVLGLIMLMAMGLKRWGGRLRMAVGGGDENLEMISRLALSTKQSVCVIRLGRQLVVVGVTPDNISALTTIDDPEMVAELSTRRTRDASASFDKLFAGEAATYEPYVEEDEPPAEIPLDDEDRSRYAQARLEISGLIDKLRRRGGRDDEPPGPDASHDDRNTIAVA